MIVINISTYLDVLLMTIKIYEFCLKRFKYPASDGENTPKDRKPQINLHLDRCPIYLW
jgi:hypothetical protein